MGKEDLKRLFPTAFLAVVCTLVQFGGLGTESVLFPMYFHFLHANVWHFLLNFSVLARFKPRWGSVPPAYLSASAASFMGFTTPFMPTVGISAIIFAMFARRDAIYNNPNWKLLTTNLALGVVPFYDWQIHMAAYLISFTGWKTYLRLAEYARKRHSQRR